MSPILINAKVLKEEDIVSIREEASIIEKELGRKPKLVIIKATDDLACQAYVRNKVMIGREVGIEVEVINIPYGTDIEDFEYKVDCITLEGTTDAVIIQEPVYPYLYDKKKIERLIHTFKDGDCFKNTNLGKVLNGNPIVSPCTPQGVIDILNHHLVKVEGKRVTVVGRSTNVGLSLSIMLTQMGAIVTTTHSKTPSLEEDVRNADIVISCVGKRNLIQPEWMKKDSVIIGVGIDFVDGKQYTDYNVNEMLTKSKCSLVGDRVNCTGTATVLNLMKNTVKLCRAVNIM